ncbi:MAG: 2-oxoglutarate dehydrogenase E1 component [Chaenotheca gracillima]|nr:MAG: 2-oxoglutarate dehydrogenase E1 component [Chaenotheca gracillima]
MRSTTSTAASNPSSRRAQPVRQTRNNPPRSSANVARPFAGARSAGAGQENAQPSNNAPGFFPAITHFTDAITALPKEIVRHFTLLKEVDAKACGPEESLAHLINMALTIPAPDRRQTASQPQQPDQEGGRDEASASLLNGGAAADNHSQQNAAAPTQASLHDEQSDLARRQLFYHLRCYLQELLVTLDEKNHVISTANEALQKQLSRVDSSHPYIDNEISEEARYGSSTHWAYTDRTQSKPNGTAAIGERSRREVAAAHNLAAVASAANEEAAATRSESRREAMLAKRQRNLQQESDFDDSHPGRHREAAHGSSALATGSSKKPPGGAKVRKVTNPAESNAGLGITNGVSDAGGIVSNKRRKTEKGLNAATVALGGPMERSISATLGSGGNVGKGGAGSPRETPAGDGPKKKAARGGPTSASTTRKRNNTNASTAGSPSIASSPVHSSFPGSKDLHRISPIPGSTQRPASSRARQNSTNSAAHEAASKGRNRPSSATSNKPAGNGARSGGQADLNSVAGLTGRSMSEVKSTMKEAAVTSKGEHVIEDKSHKRHSSTGGPGSGDFKGALVVPSGERSPKKEDAEGAGDGSNSQNNSTPGGIQQTTISTTRSSSKASKTSTPVTSGFPEMTRSRSSRAADSATAPTATGKRSHKKGAGMVAQQQQLLAARVAAASGTVGEDEGSSMQGDDEDEDDEDAEPRYCYCNQVSYGEMVACDADDCPREWFHLDCVGLSKAPNKNAKWYCDECKENLKRSKTGGNGGANISGGHR